MPDCSLLRFAVFCDGRGVSYKGFQRRMVFARFRDPALLDSLHSCALHIYEFFKHESNVVSVSYPCRREIGG